MKEPLESAQSTTAPPTPLRCITGATISGGLAFAMYSLMIAIATTFASKPIHSDNQIVINMLPQFAP